MDYEILPLTVSQLPDPIAENITTYKTYAVGDDKVDNEDEGLIGGRIVLDNGERFWVHLPENLGFVVKRVHLRDEKETDPVLKEWGKYQSVTHKPATDWPLYRWLVNHFSSLYPVNGTLELKWRPRLAAFDAIRSEVSHGKVSIYKSIEKRYDDKHTVMKPGRAFSFMFPELAHKEIIMLVDEFLKDFVKRDLTLTVGSSREDFKDAYAGQQSLLENIDHNSFRKSSSTSCMRYDFDQLDCHPAEAYASGDFKIIVVKDQKTQIAARCVVYVGGEGSDQAGPIYGVSEQAIDMVVEYLDKHSIEYRDPEWSGSKLLALKDSGNEEAFIAPYLDVEPRLLEVSPCGDYLIQTIDGDIDASQYSGLLNDYSCRCDSCGDGMTADESHYSEYLSVDMCEFCYNNEHFYCEYAEEMFHNDQSTTAYFVAHNGKVIPQEISTWAAEEGDSFVMCSDGKIWHIDDVNWSEPEDEWISHNDMPDYFFSDWDGDLYHRDMLCELKDGETVSLTEIINDPDEWDKDDNDIWFKKENEESEDE